MRIKSGFCSNLKLARTNITRVNVECANAAKIVVTCKRQSLHLNHIFPIAGMPKKYQEPTKFYAKNLFKVTISYKLT